MARISLLFSLTFVLALGSLFLTVSSQSSPSQNGDTVKSVLERFLTKFGGYIKYRSPGRKLYVVASSPTNVKATAPTGQTTKEVSQTKFDKLMSYFVRDKNHGRKLYVVPARKLYVAPAMVKAWAPTGEISGEVSQSDFDKFMSYFNKLTDRKLYVVASHPNAAVPATEDLSQSEFDKFFSGINNLRSHSRKLYTKFGFGGKGLFDAAGKFNVAGKDGFKSLNRAHKKHFASMEV